MEEKITSKQDYNLFATSNTTKVAAEKEALKKPKLTEDEINELKNREIEINSLFKSYYKSALDVNLVEFATFVKTCEKKLPITFRINKMNENSDFVEEELMSYFEKFKEPKLKKVDWYPLDNMYEVDGLNRTDPIEKEFLEFLKRENDLGIFRQELVSMIPVTIPLIKDDSVVIDFCAAPGNKTLQILEFMHEDAVKLNILPRGVLISNELNEKRSKMLVNFIKKQPTSNLIVTSCSAENFPNKTNIKPNLIFADVPCSGDGTLRKNKHLRKTWKPHMGMKDHVKQVKILENSLRVVDVGGHVVYSTCSLNPIENEAVVAYVLEQYKGMVELVDISSRIKMKYVEGLVKWKVCYDWKDSTNLKWASKLEQVPNPNQFVKASMFHETYCDSNYHAFIKDPLNLRRCIRLYAHKNNSGNFFVAVLKKMEELEGNKLYNSSVMSLNDTSKKMKTIDQDLMDIFGEETVKFYFDKFDKIKAEADAANPNADVPSNIEKQEVEVKAITDLSSNPSHTTFFQTEIDIKSSNQEQEDELEDNDDNVEESLELDPKNTKPMSEAITKDMAKRLELTYNGKDTKNEEEEIKQAKNEEVKTLGVRNEKEPENEEDDPDDFSFHSIVKFKRFKKNFLNLTEFFKITDPIILNNLFSKRETSNKVFFFNEKLNEILQILLQTNITINYAGIQICKKNRCRSKNSKCQYRLIHKGTIILEPYINSQKFYCNDDLIYTLIKNKSINFEEIRKYGDLIEKIEFGCCILKNENITLTCWKGVNNLSVTIPREELLNLEIYINKYLK